ncbi:BTAD domain-containing putative transcriptional regulator [Streptomyces adustus]|uniref:AfsR/SARP family transcriptional regulator n=1 Tax=Streptomyces adustus TaxID=1609272 RepID=UPI0035D5A8CF
MSLRDWRGGMTPTASKLLALLLSAGPEGMSARHLLFSLWGESAPPSARQMLRAHVMKLRGQLGRDHWLIAKSSGQGYCLVLDDADVDARVFENLMRQGRSAINAGEYERALRHLEEATALWRGYRALSDVRDVLELEAEAVRLEELRLIAEELIADCSLLQGRASDLVPRLAALRVRYPLREKFLGQLMLALAACDRRIEAVEIYRKTRDVFIEQAGIEPSSRLAHLHLALLRGDPWETVMSLIRSEASRPATSLPVTYGPPTHG